MILPLRRAHRSVFVALAVLLPVVLVKAWSVRRAPTVLAIDTELLPGAADHWADGLVYWTATHVEGRRLAPSIGEVLPPDAELVGTLRSGAFERTPPVGKMSLVYSLAHGRVVSWEYDP